MTTPRNRKHTRSKRGGRRHGRGHGEVAQITRAAVGRDVPATDEAEYARPVTHLEGVNRCYNKFKTLSNTLLNIFTNLYYLEIHEQNGTCVN